MPIQTVVIDPAATVLTDNDIVIAINNATIAITREAALSQNDLNLVKTNPLTGEFYIKNIHRLSDGKIEIEYEDVAVP